MKCELITVYNVRTPSGKQLSFLDKTQAELFAKDKGEYRSNLNVTSEQILVLNGVQYFKVYSCDQNELKNSIERAKIISKLSENEMKVLGLL